MIEGRTHTAGLGRKRAEPEHAVEHAENNFGLDMAEEETVETHMESECHKSGIRQGNTSKLIKRFCGLPKKHQCSVENSEHRINLG